MMGKVPSFSPSSTVSSALPGYVALCLTLQVHRLVSAQFTVTGPDDPVIASLGGEAVLSCHLSPRMSAENMEVRWFRSKYFEVVHLYRDGQDQYGEHMLEYQGRTELLKDDITNGRVSLRIRDIRPSDNGQYTCYFESSVSYEEAFMELQVAEPFFPRVSPWMVALGVILVLLAVLMALAGYCFWRRHRATEILQSEMESEKETLLSEREQEKGEYEAVKELGLARARGYAVDVTLDPDTAHPNLVLSEDRKHVSHGAWDLSNKSEGFEHDIWVLGAEGFTGGRRYWEVEVEGKIGWYLGVCRESVSRKGKVTLTPEDGYWVVWLKGEVYQALTSPSTSLPVSIRPSRVGIFLDYEAGEVSFYNVTDRSRLFTFTDTFSGTLRPYFSPGYYVWGTNADPLKIRPVPAQAGGNLSP
ncbi:butyrophilin subfamily 1 member A1-like [Terrapene carolina triunguis]|uniref:butyrophilin subfamily 1 member A1-like n=1 Tax=Terrapene triunguis TaxID=2587831 RepID=UPI000E77D1F5|nr:butyrophilin subfamily 1 member A1-like [Terrapene carolina triunguis]